jgi:hypothetical protein
VAEEFKGTPGYGDVWTWTVIDADTKLVPTWLVGERTTQDAYVFLMDLKIRLKNSHIQLTTEGLSRYMRVVDGLWAENIDYAMLHKNDGGTNSTPERTYSPAECTGIDIHVIAGNPDMGRVSTSCRAPEPNYANGDAPLYETHQRFLKEDRISRSRRESQLPLLQLRALPGIQWVCG